MTQLHMSAMRRVVHTIPSVADASSGYAQVVLQLCELMSRRNLPLELGTVDRPGHRPVPDFVRRFAPSPGPRRLGASSQLHQWLRKGARAGETGILHSHSIWTMSSVYPGWVSQWSWTPLVVSPHGTLADAAFASGSRFKSTFWRFVQRPALLSATVFHATAAAEMEDIRRHGFTQPVAVIPNGIDVPPLLRAPANPRTLLFLARIHPIKQPGLLLRAWERLQPLHPEWQLVIVGADHDSGGHLQKMKDAARDRGLKRVTFRGELVGEEKLAAYRSADLYVLPSQSENFGITVAEALAAGTPAIVTTGAPWAEIRQRAAGWWISPEIETLVGTLDEAMRKPRPELEEMGRRGRDWMLESFQWQAIADRTLELYDWIVTGMPLAGKPEWIHLEGKGPLARASEASRWTGQRKAEVVLRVLKGEPLESLSREFGVSTARLAEWRDDGVAALRAGLGPSELDET